MAARNSSRVKRPIRIDGNVAYITLTNGHTAIIDAADAPLVDGFNWFSRGDGNTTYALRNENTGTKRRTLYLHRLLMSDPDGAQVDHVNGDGLDNRRSNLRLASAQQNVFNQRLSRKNTSGLKGVSRVKATGKWCAKITLNGKSKHLGYYATVELAHAAYVHASLTMHGVFGRAA